MIVEKKELTCVIDQLQALKELISNQRSKELIVNNNGFACMLDNLIVQLEAHVTPTTLKGLK